MGYETRLYIGEVRPDPRNQPNWFQVFAMVDLCKAGTLTPENKDNTIPVYFFAEDGNTKITQDRYGEPLIAYPIEVVKEKLKTKINENYARYSWAYETLVAITKKLPGKYASPATHCILFGH